MSLIERNGGGQFNSTINIASIHQQRAAGKRRRCCWPVMACIYISMSSVQRSISQRVAAHGITILPVSIAIQRAGISINYIIL